MKTFNQFLLENQSIINKVVRRFPCHTNNVNTIEDYKRVCEMTLWKIYSENLYQDRKDKEACYFTLMSREIWKLQRSAYSTKKNQPKMSLDYKYDDKSNLEDYLKIQNNPYEQVDISDIWNTVREVLKGEDMVEEYIDYWKQGYKSVSDYCDYNNLNYQNTNNRFKKYLKILRKNQNKFKDYV